MHSGLSLNLASQAINTDIKVSKSNNIDNVKKIACQPNKCPSFEPPWVGLPVLISPPTLSHQQLIDCLLHLISPLHFLHCLHFKKGLMDQILQNNTKKFHFCLCCDQDLICYIISIWRPACKTWYFCISERCLMPC